MARKEFTIFFHFIPLSILITFFNQYKRKPPLFITFIIIYRRQTVDITAFKVFFKPLPNKQGIQCATFHLYHNITYFQQKKIMTHPSNNRTMDNTAKIDNRYIKTGSQHEHRISSNVSFSSTKYLVLSLKKIQH